MSNRARQFVVDRMEGRTIDRIQIVVSNTSEVSTQKKPCGCAKRKAWMNSVIPGSGDLVEKFTEVTGIKRLVQGINQDS